METLWSKRGYFGLLWNACILVYYPFISYQRIEVYRVETTDMGTFHWNNGVSGICNPSKYFSTYCTELLTRVSYSTDTIVPVEYSLLKSRGGIKRGKYYCKIVQKFIAHTEDYGTSAI